MVYIKTHYDDVTVIIKDNWLRLDFNHDGKVNLEDLRQGFKELYEFMINYEYLNKA